MIFAIYEIANGRLVFMTEDPSSYIGPPLSAAALNRNEYPDPMVEQWDADALCFRPFVRRTITHLKYLNRFTSAEFAMIKAGCAANMDLDFAWQKFFAAEFIDLDDAETVAGVMVLEQVGLLANGRAAEVLG